MPSISLVERTFQTLEVNKRPYEESTRQTTKSLAMVLGKKRFVNVIELARTSSQYQ